MLEAILFVLYGVLLGVFAVGVWKLRYALRHFQLQSRPATSKEHPSVTVCIPARNEDHAMTDCLQAVIASTYEKLEIIVLDDKSGDETSSLIKAFASDGVRFVQGSALPEGWLGKNHALQGLLEQASGTYVLFMDVDTRISPDSISQLVAYALQEQALMVSVLPRRQDGRRMSVIFSTLRYLWEVMFHRTAAPATASNLWLIHRQTLLDRWKSFASFKDAIQLESKLSAALMAEGKYRFLMGTEALGVAYEKKWRSQLSTSIRLLYPLLGAKTAHAIIAVLDLLIISGPLFVILAGFITGWGLHQGIAGVLYLLFAGLYAAYLRHVRSKAWILGAFVWPFLTIQEAVLVILSTYQYSKKTVTWKGRLVKVPRQLQSELKPEQ